LEQNSTFKIGITDSGFGGLSMVSEFQKSYPDVEIIYFADLKNAPYGEKDKSQVQALVQSASDVLIQEDVKAILLACNTATSVAVESLRNHLSIPIFGMEPAIKPALNATENEKVAVLATSLTLKEDRFLSLKNKIDPMNRIISVNCPGLSDLIDQEKIDEAIEYVQAILLKEDLQGIHSVVLGCTHYIFLKERLQILFPEISFFDGNKGTLNHIVNTCQIQKSQQVNKQFNKQENWKFITNLNQSKNVQIARHWMQELQTDKYTRAT
jgi:glutamate racemase